MYFGALGSSLDFLGLHFEGTGGFLGGPRPPFGRLWGLLGAILASLGGHFGCSGSRLGVLGDSWAPKGFQASPSC